MRCLRRKFFHSESTMMKAMTSASRLATAMPIV